MNYSPPGSSVHGIFQAIILEWVAIPFSRESSWHIVSWLVGEFFTIWATRDALSTPRTLNNRHAGITDEAKKDAVSEVKVTQSCPIPCDSMDCTVQGILQTRILKWVAFPSSEDLPNPGIEPRSPALQMDSLPAEPPGKPKNTGVGSLSLLQRIFPTQELNRVSCVAGRFFYQLSHQGSPKKTAQVMLSRGPGQLPKY